MVVAIITCTSFWLLLIMIISKKERVLFSVQFKNLMKEKQNKRNLIYGTTIIIIINDILNSSACQESIAIDMILSLIVSELFLNHEPC